VKLRKPGGQPPFRADYGIYIKELLSTIPATFAVTSKRHAASVRFLYKLAEYLMSEEYAAKSAKALAKKNGDHHATT